MAKVSWLHISDVHILRSGEKPDAAAAYQKHVLFRLIDFLKGDSVKWGEDIEKPRYLVVTGDLAFCGKKENYDSAKTHCVKTMIGAVAGALDIKPVDFGGRVFLVPGNHDVNREAVTDKDKQDLWLRNAGKAEWLDQLFLEAKNKDRREILSRFKEYCDFVRQLWKSPGTEPKEILWYKKSYLVTPSSRQVHFLGINSAWLCHSFWCAHMQGTLQSEEAERTDLLASPPAYIRQLLGDPSKQDLVVALMHHDYLRTRDYSSSVSYMLEDKCDFILYGHEHTESWAQPTLGRAYKIRGGRFYEHEDLRNVVNVVEVDVDTRWAKMMTIHYRTSNDGAWEIDRGHDPTSGRWKDRFSFDKGTGVLTFPLAGAETGLGDPPPIPDNVSKEIVRLAEPNRLRHCSRARDTRQRLEKLHGYASLAGSHSGRGCGTIEKRTDALVGLYGQIDLLPVEMRGFGEGDPAAWCDYLSGFAVDDVSRVAASLAKALVAVLKHRAPGGAKQRPPSGDVCTSLKEVAEYSKLIAQAIAKTGEEDMTECHARLSELPQKITTDRRRKTGVGLHEILGIDGPKTRDDAKEPSDHRGEA